MPTGKVKWFSLEKGFGFIESDEGEDVYLAATALPEGVTTVKPGTKLEFGIADGRRGPQALSVRVIEAPTSLAASSAAAFVLKYSTSKSLIITANKPLVVCLTSTFVPSLVLYSYKLVSLNDLNFFRSII